MACNKCLFLLFICSVTGRLVFGASEAQENAIWALWSLQTSSPAQHGAILAACQQMQKSPPPNPLLPVVLGLAAWHSLHLGKTNDAALLFNEMTTTPPATPTMAAGAEMGRRWLTRLDREKVRRGLTIYYRNEIEYPINLQQLKKITDDQSLTDRWGAPWQYQLAEFKAIKGLRGQRYLLQSKTLGESSDLAKALERPYAAGMLIQPLSLAISGSGAQNIIFQIPGDRTEKIILSEGGQTAGTTLTYIGSRILILCDGDHWQVVSKPAR
ncbi:MAG: hypothetical protein PHW60_05050 [Kiritimatiellae bacterium]|nr:hypothetical protein [Kiritimatiellia bacterium]